MKVLHIILRSCCYFKKLSKDFDLHRRRTRTLEPQREIHHLKIPSFVHRYSITGHMFFFLFYKDVNFFHFYTKRMNTIEKNNPFGCIFINWGSNTYTEKRYFFISTPRCLEYLFRNTTLLYLTGYRGRTHCQHFPSLSDIFSSHTS